MINWIDSSHPSMIFATEATPSGLRANYKLPRARVCTSGQAHKLWQIALPLCVSLLPQPTMCAQQPTDAHIAYTLVASTLKVHQYRWHSRRGVTTVRARRTVHHMSGHPLWTSEPLITRGLSFGHRQSLGKSGGC